MEKKDFIELAEKISTGVATKQEIAQFNRWYQSFQKDDGEWLTEEFGDQDKIEAVLLHRINQKINTNNTPSSIVIYSLRNIAAAVIVLILAAGGLYWYFSSAAENAVESTLVIRGDVQPGGDKAILTLSDGSRIVLDEANTGLLANEGQTLVQKSDEGLVRYQLQDDNTTSTGADSKEVTYNTISTPAGGQYKVVLPDESEVWLNSLSSIRFPTRFAGPVREVEITGEVFFDVTSDEHQPFWVHSGDQTVKVLGTQFNIQAYADEDAVLTTLVEGSVAIEAGSHEVQIIPGQQAINRINQTLEVEEADVEQVIAWKNGLFQFWNTDLQEIMRQLSRWYGVEVNYLNKAEDKTFSGFISRDVPLSNVLRMLEEAGNVQFGLIRNTVSVKMNTE